MSSISISVSGTKDSAKQQIMEQSGHPRVECALTDALCTIIDRGPGNHVSLSGSFDMSEDGSHGSMNLSGSFWTK